MLLVQCDFDDTITVGNVSAIIREAFGPETLASMEDEYVSGEYSVEESNIRQFALVRARKEDIDGLVRRDVVIRDGFRPFVEYCRNEGILLVVVSSGLDLYVDLVLEQLGLSDLEAHSAKTRVTPDGIEVSYTDPWGAVITSGFKDAYVRRFKQSGDTVIYIGDGLSDIRPAMEADFVMARSTLAEHLRTNDVPHFPFNNFVDICKHVGAIRRAADG